MSEGTPSERAAAFFAEVPEFEGTAEEALASSREDERASMARKWGLDADKTLRLSHTHAGHRVTCGRCAYIAVHLKVNDAIRDYRQHSCQ